MRGRPRMPRTSKRPAQHGVAHESRPRSRHPNHLEKERSVLQKHLAQGDAAQHDLSCSALTGAHEPWVYHHHQDAAADGIWHRRHPEAARGASLAPPPRFC